MLLNMLPPVVHLRDQAEQSALRWSIERMMEEMQGDQPGGLLVAQHLAHMILVQALRRHLAGDAEDRKGWFLALADMQIGPAIRAMHADLMFPWTLHEWAKCARMSRSRFAMRFKMVAGETPMEYLARWRMLMAADKLQNTTDPVSTIARAVGYQSESAFSTAFKRFMGNSPRRFACARSPNCGTRASP